MSEKKKAKAIMVQGTMSNAGKSFLVAGLCRVFKQDGYKVVGGAVVAPEKADSGNAETQAVNTKIENRIYALLPTTFSVGKAA